MTHSIISPVTALLLIAPALYATDQVVTDPGDNGASNQIRAKLAALQSTGGGRLSFDVGFATIVLTQGVLANITTNCIIDGGDAVTVSGNDASRVFIVNAGATLTLNNITISHGNNASGDGGAIRNDGVLNINHCKFLANQTASSWSGGAILSLGPLNITNSEFASNQAGNAGAIYPRFSGAVTTITSSNFHDNTTTNQTNGWGGALLLWDGAPVTVDYSSFSNNSALQGGAFYVFANSSLNVNHSTVSGNSGVGTSGTTGFGGAGGAGNLGFGGGIYNAGTATLTNCTVSGNTAGGGRGGVTNFSQAVGGRGGDGLGGGIYNLGIATLTNCTFFGNSATGGSGGTSLDGTGGLGGTGQGGGMNNNGTLTLGSCTVSANSAIAGGAGFGVDGDGQVGGAQGGGILQNNTGGNSLRNDLIAGNAATNNGLDLVGAFTSQGFNLIGKSDGSSGFTNGLNHDLVGTVAAPLDPMLGALQDNGGPTATVALLSGSPAINAGTASGAPVKDQRGLARNGPPDIGAFEFAGLLPVSLGNISTRGVVGIGDEVMIGGFIITGTADKTVLIRAIGPSLSNPPFNLANTLQDPTLSLFSGSSMIEFNDNWADASNAQSIDVNLRPSNRSESAILISLAPGAYTAIVSGVNGGTGIGLVEVFDLDATVPSRLSNISTRGLVETGDSVMIGGFVVKGPDSETVVIRAIGPSLASPPFNLTNVLQNPTVSLFNDQGTRIQFNDDWQNDQKDEIIATGLQPSNTAESALVRTLAPGNYTAIVSGVNNATGLALVEVFGLN
jgi:hypothetical protein